MTASTGNRLTIAVTSMTVFPGAQKLTGALRTIVLAVPSAAQVDAGDGTIGSASRPTLAALAGRNVVVLTDAGEGDARRRARPAGAISASRIATAVVAGHGGP